MQKYVKSLVPPTLFAVFLRQIPNPKTKITEIDELL